MAYSIFHINLNEPISIPLNEPNLSGYYFIIWYKTIPLADFYIDKGTIITNQIFNDRLIHALKDTISFYTSEPEENWQYLINHNGIEHFCHWFSQFNHEEIVIKNEKSYQITVIVCTRNRPAYLKKCLISLQALKYKPDEIIVVDNASNNNDTKDIVMEYDNIRYITEPRLGLDIARNTGISNATMPVVAFIDDDAEAHPYWIYRIWQTFETTSITAMTGLVFPSKLNTNAQILFEKYFTFNRGYKSKVYDESFINQNTSTGAPVWEIGAGVNMAFRKNIFNQVGYFDELLDAGAAGCNGDSEMWFRILANGNKICYNPKAVVHHEHREDMASLEKQIFNYMKGNTTAALMQQSYHPTSKYKKFILNTIKKKTKTFIYGIIKGRWFLLQVLKLEFKGIFAGIFYYYRTK